MRFEAKCSDCGKTIIYDDQNIIYAESGQTLNDRKVNRAQMKIFVPKNEQYEMEYKFNFCKECTEKYFINDSNSEVVKDEKLIKSFKQEKDQSKIKKFESTNPIEQAYQLLVKARDGEEEFDDLIEDRIDDAIGCLGELLDDGYEEDFKYAFNLGAYTYSISIYNDDTIKCYVYENGDWRYLRSFNEIEHKIFTTLVNNSFTELAESLIRGKKE